MGRGRRTPWRSKRRSRRWLKGNESVLSQSTGNGKGTSPTNTPKLLQPPRNFQLTAAWHCPSLHIHPSKSTTPPASQESRLAGHEGSCRLPSMLSVPLQVPAQQTPTFTAHPALCHHRLLVAIRTQHKPPNTRASPGLHSARHKYSIGISGVSNPSCCVGSVRSLLSTHTPTSRQRLGGELIYSLFTLLPSILTAIMLLWLGNLRGSHGEQTDLFPFHQSHSPSCPLNTQPRDPPHREHQGVFHLTWRAPRAELWAGTETIPKTPEQRGSDLMTAQPMNPE